MVAKNAARSAFGFANEGEVTSPLQILARAEHVRGRARRFEGGIDGDGHLEIIQVRLGFIDAREGVVRDAIGAIPFGVEEELKAVIVETGRAELRGVFVISERVVDKHREDVEVFEVVSEIGADAEIGVVGFESVRAGVVKQADASLFEDEMIAGRCSGVSFLTGWEKRLLSHLLEFVQRPIGNVPVDRDLGVSEWPDEDLASWDRRRRRFRSGPGGKRCKQVGRGASWFCASGS